MLSWIISWMTPRSDAIEPMVENEDVVLVLSSDDPIGYTCASLLALAKYTRCTQRMCQVRRTCRVEVNFSSGLTETIYTPAATLTYVSRITKTHSSKPLESAMIDEWIHSLIQIYNCIVHAGDEMDGKLKEWIQTSFVDPCFSAVPNEEEWLSNFSEPTAADALCFYIYKWLRYERKFTIPDIDSYITLCESVFEGDGGAASSSDASPPSEPGFKEE